jgi:hypothetical protein
VGTAAQREDGARTRGEMVPIGSPHQGRGSGDARARFCADRWGSPIRERVSERVGARRWAELG